jgi:hypothetical protein
MFIDQILQYSGGKIPLFHMQRWAHIETYSDDHPLRAQHIIHNLEGLQVDIWNIKKGINCRCTDLEIGFQVDLHDSISL